MLLNLKTNLLKAKAAAVPNMPARIEVTTATNILFLSPNRILVSVNAILYQFNVNPVNGKVGAELALNENMIIISGGKNIKIKNKIKYI